MRFIHASLLAIAVLALVSCNRDPNVAKRRYLESGNKYFDKGKFKEARLMYKDAIQKDRLFGPAYYKLGITELKLGMGGPAVQDLRRAIELLPATSPDRWDSMVQLSQLYLLVAGANKEYQDEVQGYVDQLLKRDPNSFDAHRLQGDLLFRKALEANRYVRSSEGIAMFKTAMAEFQRADALKPNEPGVRMQMARCMASLEDTAGAEKTYREVLEKAKELHYVYNELYRLLIYLKKYPEAEQVLKLGFQNNPKDYEFLIELARHYAGTQQRPEMLGVLQQIKAHAKDYPGAYLAVGDFYLLLGDGDSAMKEYREGIDKDPKQKVNYQKRVVEVLMRQGKRSEAADANALILKDNPNDNDAKGVAATLLLDKGQVNEALGELQQVVTRSPNNAVAHFNLGNAYRLKQQREQARQEYMKAIEIRPDYLDARLALADLQVTYGEYDAGIKTVDEILALDRSNPRAALVKSAAYTGQGKYADARAILDPLSKALPNSPDVQLQIGQLNLRERKYKEAEAAYRRCYELYPAAMAGLRGVVETLMAQNKPDEALQVLQSEAARSPNRVDIRFESGMVAGRTGKFDVALAEFQKVLDGMDKAARGRAPVYLRVGEIYRRKGDDAAAIAAFQKGREVSPEDTELLVALGLTLDHAGRWNEARQLYEATLKATPNSPVALNNLAFLMAEHGGDLDDALTKAQRAKQLWPNVWEISDTLGWIYLKKNLADSAIDIFRDLTTKAPNNSTYRYHLGLALSQKGDKPKAIKELQEAMKNNPERDEKQKIQDLLTRLSGA
jgi:tetratricopeptide (TPR) repeat protein